MGVAAAIEQGGISIKHATDVHLDTADVLSKAITSASYGDGRALSNFMQTYQDKISKDVSRYVAGRKTAGDARYADLTEKQYETEGYKRATEDFVNNVRRLGPAMRDFDSLNRLRSQDGADIDTINRAMHFMPEGSTLAKAFKGLDDTRVISKDRHMIDDSTSAFEREDFRDAVGAAVAEGATKVSKNELLRKLGSSVIERATHSGINGVGVLAMGALGMAGALMIAGFVGGNPAPADTQASQQSADESGDDEDYYNVPSLQQNTAQSGSQGGYVININAQTNQGRAHAVQALNQAIRQGTDTNVNISMNINQNQGNISNSRLDGLLSGALN
jgi:hypothetical protein